MQLNIEQHGLGKVFQSGGAKGRAARGVCERERERKKNTRSIFSKPTRG